MSGPARLCDREGCGKPTEFSWQLHSYKRYCSDRCIWRAYKLRRKAGEAPTRLEYAPSFWAAFWEHVEVAPPAACWLWPGDLGQSGYGKFRFTECGRRRSYPAHRIALAWRLGREPIGFACHHCDEPLCVNPAHIYEGSAAENAGDREARRRNRRTRSIRNHPCVLCGASTDRPRFCGQRCRLLHWKRKHRAQQRRSA